MKASTAPQLAELSPMLLSERKTPPEDQDEYLVEVKWDGYRVLAEYGDGHCRLQTRGGVDCSKWFPEVRQALAVARCGRTIIDGEMCCLDELGRSDFDALHARARRKRLSAGDLPAIFCAFDLLVVDGRSIMDWPLEDRKARLAELLDPVPSNVLYSAHVDASMVVDPMVWFYDQALALQLEGIVAKRKGSTYQPGVRSPDWFKWKRKGAVPPQRFRR